MNYVVIIPARYKSTRLPGKPLIPLGGVPMIQRTYQRCVEAVDKSKVYVATDDKRIAALCESQGIRYVMTSESCLTGTDRVAEAASMIDADFYLNVQGDEPLFNPHDISLLEECAQKYPGRVLNGYCEINDAEQFRSPSTPKVVFRPDGRLLYMSRAPIPTDKSHAFVKSWRQVCAYAFPRQALMDFASKSNKTPLEEIEDIEILRFLEIGWDVHMVPMSSESIAVDNPEDIVRVEKVLSEIGRVDD